MHTKKSFRSFVITVLLFAFGSACIQAPAYAAMLSTQDLAMQQQLQGERSDLQQRLLRDDVKAQLQSLGVSQNMVEARINSMTSAEIAQVNGQLDALPAGGGALGTVVLVLVLLILLEIVGAIDIFNKI